MLVHVLHKVCIHTSPRVLQCVAERCSVLQCVAVRCSVLQCVAVRCSVLQCVAASAAMSDTSQRRRLCNLCTRYSQGIHSHDACAIFFEVSSYLDFCAYMVRA